MDFLWIISIKPLSAMDFILITSGQGGVTNIDLIRILNIGFFLLVFYFSFVVDPSLLFRTNRFALQQGRQRDTKNNSLIHLAMIA